MTGKYTLKDTSSGKKTLIYNGNREIKLHSAYDPVKEAERNISSFHKGRSSIIVVSGLGLGYHINSLKNKYPSTQIIVIEHDSEVIEITEKNNPRYLKNIPVINSSHDLGKIFEDIDMSHFKGISHLVHKPSHMIYPDFYDSLIADIKQYISSKVSDLLTRFEFEERWVENIFKNIHHVYNSGRVFDLFGKFNGIPGIIVSAGPSLRKNIDLLSEVKESALIVSVDTAIKVLEKRNIEPHIVMTLDAQKHSIKHFLGLKSSGTVLLADVVSYPAILRSFQGDKIISTTSKYYTTQDGDNKRETTPVMDWIEKFMDPIGDIQSGGSVATSAFDLLLNLGCSPIILMGQDLAYTGREIHCSGTHHNDEWVTLLTRLLNLDTINQKVIRKRKIKYVESYSGKGKVISDFVFDLYRGWFEDSSSKVKVDVINSTGGGARIKNTDEKSVLEIIKNKKSLKNSPGNIIKKAILKNKNTDPIKMIHAFEDGRKKIKNIIKIIKNTDSENNETNILNDIEKNGLGELFNPFIRKTSTYILRHSIGPSEAAKMLNQNILVASEKLIKILENALINLKKI